MKKATLLFLVLMALACILVSCNNNVEKYQITFEANGGEGEMSSQTVVRKQSTKLSANKFTRENYAFSGWALSADGEKVYDDRQSVSAVDDMTLYALWTRVTYTVKFDPNGGDGQMANQVVKVGESVKLSANTFTNADDFYFGWATEPSGQKVYSDEQEITPMEDMTLYAVWGDRFSGRWTLEGDESSYVEFDGFGAFKMSIDLGGGQRLEGKGDYLTEGQFILHPYKCVEANCIAFVISNAVEVEPYVFTKFSDGKNKVQLVTAETEIVNLAAYNGKPIYETYIRPHTFMQFDLNANPRFCEVTIDFPREVLTFLEEYRNTGNPGSFTAETLIIDIDFNPLNDITSGGDVNYAQWVVQCFDAMEYNTYYCPFNFSDSDTVTVTVNENGTPVDLTFVRQ